MKRAFLIVFVTAGLLPGAAAVRWTHLSSVTGELPVPDAAPEPTASLLVDLDHDGDQDIVVGARHAGPCLVWYRWEGRRWRRYVLDASAQRIEAGGAFHDIDGDGDPDLVFGADAGDNKIWWWENPYPKFDPKTGWKRRLIKNSGSNKHHDQMFGDFDGDGKVELVSWNQGARSLLLFEIPDQPRTAGLWPVHVIYSWKGKREHEGLAAADINLDGRPDIVGGGRWFEHLTGFEFEAHVVDDAYRFSRAVAGQFDKGGRPEIVFGPGDNVLPLRIYEWRDGRWSDRDLLPGPVNHGHSLRAGDIDGDGNLDLFCAEMGQWGRSVNNPNARMWVFYGDGKGHFQVQLVEQGQGTHESRLGDLDGDGDLDIFGKPFRHNCPRLDVWRNDGPGKEKRP